MIPRQGALKKIESAFRVHPIAALLGPRLCGKTTLARMLAEHEPCTYFDLENPVDNRRLSAPLTALEDLKLEHLWIVYPGDQEYSVDEKITVFPLREIARLPSKFPKKKPKKP